MPVKEVNTMKDADMYQALETIALGAHDEATRKAVADKMLAYALKLTSSTVETLPMSILKIFKTLLGQFNLVTLRKINKETLHQLSILLAPAFEVQKVICVYRSKEAGFPASAYCSSGYDQEMKNILAAVATPAAAAGKRRKRNAAPTTPVTCIDIIGLGNGVTYLTTAQLKTIADQEFKDCASRLGNPALAFDLAQIGELSALALKYWGATSTWTPDTVRKAGGMVVGLSVFDLETLVIADLEAAMRIGTAKGWALLSSVDRDTKLSAAFAQFSKGLLASDIKKISGSHLRMISNLACGVSANKIKSEVPVEAIGSSVIELGLLKTCTANQLTEYAQKAIKVHGKIPEPRYMQILIGGLTGKQLDLLKPSQIKELSPSTIENLPAAILIKFTVEQLRAFTPSMAARMTAKQRKALPKEKREVILKILRDNLPAEAVRDDADNSAATSYNPWIVFTLTVVLLLTDCKGSMI
ncbi:uncharacterized protein LOC135498955 isoform X2 [Lineus longissimus]|uniref:uncharacterized protein LOC135498955 isoform X2 n=1 Tax=Lineus longissimus TaxID=88925 RepID=UPI00315C5DA4